MKYLLKQVDLMNRNSLYYLEHLDAFEVMEAHILDRVMQEYWQSSLDASGSFFAASTAYNILFSGDDDGFAMDHELAGRFYKER